MWAWKHVKVIENGIKVESSVEAFTMQFQNFHLNSICSKHQYYILSSPQKCQLTLKTNALQSHETHFLHDWVYI